MKRIIGLTGGIGSGKTTVGYTFESFGMPVYNSDHVAKEILKRPEIIQKIGEIFPGAIHSGMVSRPALASLVFQDKDQLAVLNSIIHPEVGSDFQQWSDRQQGDWVIKESAILFETGLDATCNIVITVSAPEKIRIARVMHRDGISEDDVRRRMENQISDEEREAKSDFVIVNTELSELKPQIAKILKKLHIL